MTIEAIAVTWFHINSSAIELEMDVCLPWTLSKSQTGRPDCDRLRISGTEGNVKSVAVETLCLRDSSPIVSFMSSTHPLDSKLAKKARLLTVLSVWRHQNL